MYTQLKIFREERNLEHSPGFIVANITDENKELQIEILNNNELGMICELADHVIYAINAIEATGHDAQSNIECINNYDSQLLDDPSPNRAVSCILIALASYNLEKDVKALALIAKIALNAIGSMGYYAERCVLEKCKTINSRKGSHNYEVGKWQKDPHQDPSTIYQPQYASCKK